MADKFLRIASEAGEVIESRELSQDGLYGVEITGLSGLGLPPVELQFDTTMGDGAKYRGKRYQQKTINCTIQVYASSYVDLVDQCDRIARVVSGRVTLSWVDPASTTYAIKAYRSSGGDFQYGQLGSEGSDGTNAAILRLSFTTEAPFWEALAAEELTSSTDPTIPLYNPGTAPSAPTFTVAGPSKGFLITNNKGDRISWGGILRREETITIDCANGTVKDQDGHNRYPDLAETPSFFNIEPGDNNLKFDADTTSAEYDLGQLEAKTNFVKNPDFENSLAQWTESGFSYGAANKRAECTPGEVSAVRPYITTPIVGLVPGKHYIAKAYVHLALNALYPPGTRPMGGQLVIVDGGWEKRVNIFNFLENIYETFEVVLPFYARSSNVEFWYYPPCGITPDDEYVSLGGNISRAYLGVPSPYFDGSTPDNSGYNYAWTGTAHASESTATPLSAPDPGDPWTVTVSYKPRKLMVI